MTNIFSWWIPKKLSKKTGIKKVVHIKIFTSKTLKNKLENANRKQNQAILKKSVG